jgi:hypothetical protein
MGASCFEKFVKNTCEHARTHHLYNDHGLINITTELASIFTSNLVGLGGLVSRSEYHNPSLKIQALLSTWPFSNKVKHPHLRLNAGTERKRSTNPSAEQNR